MSKNTFEPLGDKIICREIAPEEMSSGGIIIPDVENQRVYEAEVIAIGPGRYEGGQLVPASVKIGDKILYQRFSAQTFEFESDEYHTVRESEIICKLH